jgi:hypothetical protein
MQASSWSWSLFAGLGFVAAVSAQAANSGAPSAASLVENAEAKGQERARASRAAAHRK